MEQDEYICAEVCVSKYVNRLLLVLVAYSTLYLLVPTRCSIVIDLGAQGNVSSNKFCTNEAAQWCKPGTHVLCMYNVSELGPRCEQGGIVPLEYQEREYIRQIFNGFKRELSKGHTVLGKDNVALPRANEMHALHWDFQFARMAQAWANQCDPTQTDLCRNLGSETHPKSMWSPRVVFKNAGQLSAIIRFNYPDWTYPGHTFEQKGGPEPTVEKLRFAITRFAKSIYDSKRDVTPEIIRNYTHEQTINPYLLIVYGYSSRFGCGVTKFVDHAVGIGTDETRRYHSLMFVCDTAHRPGQGFAVYNTDYSRGYCTCYQFQSIDRIDDCLCSDRLDPVDHPIQPPPRVRCYKSRRNDFPGGKPAMVLMPIVTVEDADPNTLQNKRVALNGLKENLRQKIKDRVKSVRDRYFKNYFVVDPGTRFSNEGPIDNSTFILFKPESKKPNLSRKATELKIPPKKKQHTVKPRKDFSNMDQLVSEYLAHKRKLNTHISKDIAAYNDERKFYDATVTPVDSKSSQGVTTRGLQYGVRGTVEEYNKNIHNTVLKKMLNTRTGVPGTYNNFLRPMKNIRKGDLRYIIDPSIIDYEKEIIGTQRNQFSSRIQNPLHFHSMDMHNFDINKQVENGYRNVDYDNPPAMLISPDYEDGQFRNGDAYLDKISSGDNHGLNVPYVYDANKISRDYLDGSNYRRPLKHHDIYYNRFDHRRRKDSIESHSHDQRYLTPDRLNHMREI